MNNAKYVAITGTILFTRPLRETFVVAESTFACCFPKCLGCGKPAKELFRSSGRSCCCELRAARYLEVDSMYSIGKICALTLVDILLGSGKPPAALGIKTP
jgi:hypothetical protein